MFLQIAYSPHPVGQNHPPVNYVDFQGVMVGMETYYIHPLPCLSDNLKFALSMKYRLLSLCNLLAPILHAAMVALGGAIPANAHHKVQAVFALIDLSASKPLLADALFIFQTNKSTNTQFGDFYAAIRSHS
jgi:hypothetical protein